MSVIAVRDLLIVRCEEKKMVPCHSQSIHYLRYQFKTFPRVCLRWTKAKYFFDPWSACCKLQVEFPKIPFAVAGPDKGGSIPGGGGWQPIIWPFSSEKVQHKIHEIEKSGSRVGAHPLHVPMICKRHRFRAVYADL